VEVEPFAFGLSKQLSSSECDIYAFFSFLLGGDRWFLSFGTLFVYVVSALLKEAHHSNGCMPRLFGLPGTCGDPDPANCDHRVVTTAVNFSSGVGC
jgi:hypothetical protein